MTPKYIWVGLFLVIQVSLFSFGGSCNLPLTIYVFASYNFSG